MVNKSLIHFTQVYGIEIEENQKKFRDGEQSFLKHFSGSDFDRMKNFVYQVYPTQLTKLGFNGKLCHGDLGFWNVIYNSEKIGIIDFGDVAYYDEAIDFAGMIDSIVFDSAVEGKDATLIEKAKLRMKLTPIVELPYFVENGNQIEMEKTVERIRKTHIN